MISPNTYEEVYEILCLIDKGTLTKIPKTVLENIDKRRNSKYKTRIDKNNIFNRNNISEEALNLLCYIEYHYLLDSNEKNKVSKIISELEMKSHLEKAKKFNSDDIFRNINRDIQEKEKSSEETKIVVLQEKKWYKKLFNRISHLFKRE